jgi:hypothetical protein
MKKDEVLRKLNRIEALQREMINDWSFVEDFILELASKSLKKDIRLGRKEYRAGKAIPYSKVRSALGLA